MNEILIDGIVGSWAVSADTIKYQLSNMSGDVTVKINSAGGSVIEGIAIYNTLKEYDKGKVIVLIIGAAASIASYIALAGSKVKAYANAIYMIHNASLPVIGDYQELRKGADISEGLSSLIAKRYISKTGKSDKEIRKLMEEETYYYGSEMKEAGFIDEIISIEDEEKNIDKAEALALATQQLQACNNELYKHKEEFSYEAVAQFLPKAKQKEEVVDLSAQQQRERKLKILQMEMTI